MIRSKYLNSIFEKPRLVIDRVCRVIRKEFPNCNGIVTADGISGTSIIVPVALRLKLPWAIARTKVNSHSNYDVEGNDSVSKYVFIDDCIATGNTFSKTYTRLYEWNKSRPAGIVIYRSSLAETFGYRVDKECFVNNSNFCPPLPRNQKYIKTIFLNSY